MDIRPPERTATLFARSKTRDGTLRRIAGWGLGAAFSLATLAVVAQSSEGGARIRLAIAGLQNPTTLLLAARPQAEPATGALERRIADLTSDRDRLAARVAALEGQFEDMTGSIRNQTAAAAQGTAPAAVPVETARPAAPLPMIVAVAPPMINPLATPPAGVASILPEATPPKEPARETPVHETAPSPAAADAAAPVPLPPERLAEATPAETAKPVAAPARARTEYGIELATEPSMDGLRRRWAGVKANFGPLLIGLSPVAVRDRHPGSSAVRLVAGPLPSLKAAHQLCARFAAMKGECWPARINPADVVQQ